MKFYVQSEHFDTLAVRKAAFKIAYAQDGGHDTSEEWRVRGAVPAKQAGLIKAKLTLQSYLKRVGSEIGAGDDQKLTEYVSAKLICSYS